MGNSVERFQNSQWQKLENLNFSKRAILSLLKTGSVLDIGCGDGLLLEHLQKNGLKVKGVDISSRAIEICKTRGLDCMQTDITDVLPFADNSYDSILLIDVLEHLFQPGEMLKEAHRITKKSVYISVPNFASLPARLQALVGKIPENNTPRDGHVYWMTWKVINDFLKSTGFEVKESVFNTFWERIPFVSVIMNFLKKVRPQLFALSFIIHAEKIPK